jgi:Na+/H+ antiporter NhaD/arsenite permease-like protein
VKHAVLDEYVPFIVLLFSLYVIAGGLRLRGDLLALPAVNMSFLLIGGLMASLIGTTGASMVLIRPLLQTNRDRKHVAHTIVFFIFIVSNVGGTLLPIGDPPLFLGYLKGVPFFWTLRLALPWLVCLGVLLGVYYIWDRFVAFPREPEAILRTELEHYRPIRVDGRINLLWLGGVVAAVAWLVPGKPLAGTAWRVPDYLRELVLLAFALLSLATTPRGLRRDVAFTYEAILEVAALFLGIFLTMQVPIEILQARGRSLGLTAPIHFFWSTGLLSSFLDNAPTYVVFLETARSVAAPAGTALVELQSGGPIAENLLAAVSLGAVFMGANTYIGNGPNFMVKSIAESHGVRMPGFFGYMLYSVAILIPLFVAIGWLFLRDP